MALAALAAGKSSPGGKSQLGESRRIAGGAGGASAVCPSLLASAACNSSTKTGELNPQLSLFPELFCELLDTPGQLLDLLAQFINMELLAASDVAFDLGQMLEQIPRSSARWSPDPRSTLRRVDDVSAS